LKHEPVLLDEVVRLLEPAGAELIVDGTVGGGGHSRALLEAAGPQARLIGFDWDEQALAHARERLAPFGDRVELIRANFAEMDERLGDQTADVILLDLGLSAFHVESPERGFSFSDDGPLDMRMDNRRETTAEALVNRLDQKALAELLHRYGGEHKARAIAGEIVRTRRKERITTTKQLADAVIRGKRQRGYWKIHPATRTFQALRMVVNDEEENIQRVVPAAANRLKPGGRLGIIAFHSGEDRLIKVNFKQLAAMGGFDIVTKKPLTAGREEQRQNRRARSAKLRVLQKQG
jgi:16S rRNA (cytosine1402-N4)-methyltransferase